jgi:DNA-binding MarR family transcriptional regulator
VQGVRHCLVPVLVAMQLFSISRDEQEGVVGAGAEHQYRDDAAHLGISSGSATGLVDRLESAGHVRRQPHPSDRRRLVIAPTDSAARDVIEVLRPMLDDLDALGGQFTEPEQRVVEQYLRQAALRLRAYATNLDASVDKRGQSRRSRPGSAQAH